MLIRPAIAFATSLAAAPLAVASPTPGPLAPQFGSPELINSPTTYVDSIVVVDVTEDGWPDVLTTSSIQTSVVLFPSTGPGTFGPSTTVLDLSSAAQPLIGEVEVADFNGDGRMDLLLQTSESDALGPKETLSVALATGPGEWAAPWPIVDLASVTLIGSALDYDGDQNPDVLYSVLDYGNSQQELRVLPGLGDGTFLGPVVLASGSGIQSGLRGAADFDGDGDLDILDAPDYNTLGFRRNEGAAGLAPRVVIDSVFFSVIDPVIADFDSDGDLDIAHTSDFADVIALYLNDGTGDFTPGRSLIGSGPTTSSLAAMDFDLDGRIDLVAAKEDHDEILLHRGLGGAVFAPPVAVAEGLGARASWVLATDLDLDGRKDLVVGEHLFGDGPSATRVLFHRNGGAGLRLDEPVSLTSSAFGAVGLDAMDLDGDGDEELLFLPRTTGAVTAMENLGFAERGGFGPAREIEATFAINDRVAVGDLDGDGDPDLITRSGTEASRYAMFATENLGPLGFGTPAMVTDDPVGQVVLGDFDSDGDLDVAVDTSPSAIIVYENLGSMGFSAGAPLDIPGDFARTLLAGDVTGDGVDDLIALSESYFPVDGFASLLRGSSTGLGLPTTLLASTTRIFDVAVDDLNGDGWVDLVVAGDGANGLRLIAGRPGGGFDPAIPLAAGTRLHVETADIDLDGAVDIVVSGYTNGTAWLRGLGLGSFAAPALIHQAPQSRLLDVEGDGDLDLALLDFESGEILMIENRTRDRVGVSICGPAIPNSTGSPGRIEAVGTAVLAEGLLTLRARNLPLNVPGYFLAARSTGVTFPVTGSQGRLCLAGPIGRFVGSGEVQDSGPSGWFNLSVDATALPTPGGFAPALAGEAWYFQAWHRDASAAGGTTNFTDGLAVTWQ